MLKNIKDLITNDSLPKNKKLIQIIILIISSVLVYVNILPNTFIMDDRTIFFSWPEVKSFNIPALLEGSYPARYSFQPVYRPVKGVIHALSYHISNNNQIFYHLQSIFVHASITILIYLIITKITKKTSLAFLTALIFAVHPIHTESITFMTASFDTIGAMFFFLSFYLYLKYKFDKNKPIFYFLSLIFAFLSFLTYEITLILPILLILYDLCFGHLNRKNWKESVKYVPYFIFISLYIGLKSLFQPNLNTITYYAGSFSLTMLTSLKALLNYIFLLFVPLKLSVIDIMPGNISSDLFDSNSVENFKLIHSQKIFEPTAIFAVLIILVSMLAFFYFFRKKPIISFSLGWFYISLLPVSNIFPLRQFMAERYAYIASFGLILLFSYTSLLLYESKKIKPILKNSILIILILVVFLFSFLTITRNFDYKDRLSMFKSISKQENGGYYTRYFLGRYYFASKDYKSSVYYLNLLTKSQYNYIYKDAYYWLGMSSIKIGQISEAKKTYDDLIRLNPYYDKERLKIFKNLISINTAGQKLIDQKTSNKIYNANNFDLEYPNNWKIIYSPDFTTLISNDNKFNIKIESNALSVGETKENYILNSKIKKYGDLIQEGVAKIPSAQYAYIRIWNQNNVKVAHFMLFNKKNVVEVFATPFEKEYMNDLNLVLNSIKFSN